MASLAGIVFNCSSSRKRNCHLDSPFGRVHLVVVVQIPSLVYRFLVLPFLHLHADRGNTTAITAPKIHIVMVTPQRMPSSTPSTCCRKQAIEAKKKIVAAGAERPSRCSEQAISLAGLLPRQSHPSWCLGGASHLRLHPLPMPPPSFAPPGGGIALV